MAASAAHCTISTATPTVTVRVTVTGMDMGAVDSLPPRAPAPAPLLNFDAHRSVAAGAVCPCMTSPPPAETTPPDLLEVAPPANWHAF
jgi:hypothetical protein